MAIPLAITFAAWFVTFAVATWLIALAVPFAIAFATGLVALTIAAGFVPFAVTLNVALFLVAVAFPILVAIGPILGKQQQAGGQPGKEDA